MTTKTRPFVFDKDYDNLAQVAHLYEAYIARYRELQQAGTYPYNDLFKGRIEGLVAEDRDEDTAIYLLQVTRRVREYEAEVQTLRDEGYWGPTVPSRGTHLTKCASVAIVSREYKHYGTIRVFEGGRLYSEDGRITAVLPKGTRKHGHAVRDGAYVLVTGQTKTPTT